ncbi:MAG: CoA transferase [Rudaea sp.]|nr:CoA transferase [Rudaea sp.]
MRSETELRLEELLAARLGGLDVLPRKLLRRDAPGGLAIPGIFSANGACRLLPTLDGWLALNLARPDDIDLVNALTGASGDPWPALVPYCARRLSAELRDRAIELQLPVAMPGEALPLDLAPLSSATVPRRVLDLSALWAGPLCAGLLGRSGARVVRIESIGRPDPTPDGSPKLDAFVNRGKFRLPLDLREVDGRKRLLDEVANCNVLVTSARPAALARLGLEPDMLAHLTWVAITAHGFTGPAGARVGFGDDCAVAGGLFEYCADTPRFLGDALSDPLTGLEAARAVLSGRTGLIDIPMARVAAAYAAMLA